MPVMTWTALPQPPAPEFMTSKNTDLTKHTDLIKDKDDDGNELNPFAEMLRVMTTEHLIRFRRRLQKVGRKRMVEILTDEIEEREALEKEEASGVRRKLSA